MVVEGFFRTRRVGRYAAADRSPRCAIVRCDRLPFALDSKLTTQKPQVRLYWTRFSSQPDWESGRLAPSVDTAQAVTDKNDLCLGFVTCLAQNFFQTRQRMKRAVYVVHALSTVAPIRALISTI